jgi:ABC-type transport system substrate-binding protein
LLENAVLTQRTTSRDFDMWSTYITRIDPDQLSSPYFRSDSPGNSAGYTGADELIDKARTEPDAATRAKLYRDLQDKISQDSPAVFVISVAEGLLINKRVTGPKSAGWQERHDWFNVDVPAE